MHVSQNRESKGGEETPGTRNITHDHRSCPSRSLPVPHVSFVAFHSLATGIVFQSLCNALFPVSRLCSHPRASVRQRKRVPLLVFTLSNILTLISYILRAVSEFAPADEILIPQETLSFLEDVILAIALPLSWFYLIFFAGGMKLTGPFVSMIRFMMVQDMTQFSVIYLIFIYAFSQGE